MTDVFCDSASFVTVAVAFDRHTERLVQVGASVAASLGKKLCLVHVDEPWAYTAYAQPIPGVPQYWAALDAAEQAARDRSKQQIAELAKKVSGKVEVTTRLAFGRIGPELLSAAKEVGTCLLIAGVTFSEHQLVTGLSTAVPLLSSAPFPVMVLDSSLTKANLFDKPKLLVADDLSEKAVNAIAFTATLGEACRGSSVVHAHFSALSREDLQTALENAAAAARTALTAEEAKKVYDSLQAELRRTLETRFSDHREYLEAAGSTYTPELLAGRIRSELDTLVERVKADVLIFGRHETIHTQPFSLGRLPYRAMLTMRKPMIIVPGA